MKNLGHFNSYRTHDNCTMCKHVFKRDEFDGIPEYYCTYGAPKRPKCGSHLMGELAGWNNKAWLKWSEDRQVDKSGICDFYEE